jgi:hypothetical protein
MGLSLLLLSMTCLVADDVPKPPAKNAETKKPAATSKADELAALQFARENHPELSKLLEQLGKSNPSEYKRAIRDLSQASTRLDRIKTQTPARYAGALESWKLDSRIRLLAARGAMTDDPALEAELKDAIKRRVELRLQDLSSERDRLSERVKKLDEQIEAIKADPDQAAENDLRRVKASIKKNAPKRTEKKPAQPAKKAKRKPPKDSADDAKPSNSPAEASTTKD